MGRILFLNNYRFCVRIPIKWAVFALTVLVVCFPIPGRFIRHLRHWSDPSLLVQPDAVALEPLVEELLLTLPPDQSPAETLKDVERFVHEKIKYEWDWNTWGTADYMPTVTEAIAMGREDCDGRAVVAASLLRRLGYQADLVTDFTHVWVKTDHGETMGPGEERAIVATDKGLKIRWGSLSRLPRALAFGVAVFPFLREAIIVGMLWLLLLRSGGGLWCSLMGLLCFANGLLLLKAGGHYLPIVWLHLAALVNFAVGFVVMLVWARRNVGDSERTPD